MRLIKLLRRIGLRLGIIKPDPYTRDVLLPNVINRIVASESTHGAYVVAVETKQGMVQFMGYMRKNGVDACAIASDPVGRFHRLDLKIALNCMEAAPYKYQVYVISKSLAATGWRIPAEYEQAWGTVSLLTTFAPRDPWYTQFKARLRKHS